MKRLFAVVIAVLLAVCSLAACGSESAANVDLKSALSDINSQFGLSDLKVLENTSDLDRYYSVSEADVKSFAAELTTAAKQYNEVIIIEANDAAAAENIKSALNAHLDSQLSTAKSYDADAVAMIESCSVKTSGNFVYLVIGESAAAINSLIEKAING